MSKDDMLGALIRAVVGVPRQFLGVTLDVVNKLGGKDGGCWYEKLRLLLREGVAVKGVAKTTFLCLLPGAEALPLSACRGTYTLAQAKDVFRGFIDPDLKNWGLDVPGISTPATRVQVYELVKDGTFREMFISLSSDLDKLCLSQHQIRVFCQERPDWLRQDGYGTVFLFKEKGWFFVAYVRMRSDGLYVGVGRFENGDVWRAESRSRIVSPQLEAQEL